MCIYGAILSKNKKRIVSNKKYERLDLSNLLENMTEVLMLMFSFCNNLQCRVKLPTSELIVLSPDVNDIDVRNVHILTHNKQNVRLAWFFLRHFNSAWVYITIFLSRTN